MTWALLLFVLFYHPSNFKCRLSYMRDNTGPLFDLVHTCIKPLISQLSILFHLNTLLLLGIFYYFPAVWLFYKHGGGSLTSSAH